MIKEKMKPADVTSLCDAGIKALGMRKSRVEFTWRGARYLARNTLFAVYVDSIDGEPIAKRYND
jgi:hypothetical protein